MIQNQTKEVNNQGAILIQNDLNNFLTGLTLGKWNSIFKCCVIHLRYNNLLSSCKLGDKEIKAVDFEKDVAVIVANKIKFSQHCNKIVKKANSPLGLMKRTIKGDIISLRL